MSQSSKMHDFFVGGIIGLVQAGIGLDHEAAITCAYIWVIGP